MARNLQLALSLLARDGASKVLKQAMQDIIKQTRATQKAGDEQAKSQQQNTSSANAIKTGDILNAYSR